MMVVSKPGKWTNPTEAAMTAMRIPGMLPCIFPGICGALLAGAALVLAFAPPGVHAQNAAQRAALAQLRRGHAKAKPETAPQSGVEATSIALNSPTGLAFDTVGNIYIAYTGKVHNRL